MQLTQSELKSIVKSAIVLVGARTKYVAFVNNHNIAQLLLLIQHESSNDPEAVNLTDSNARAGHPSKGLMQLTDSTFQQYRIAGTSQDIFDPLANIAAGISYILARYGSIDSVPGLIALREGKKYVGY